MTVDSIKKAKDLVDEMQANNEEIFGVFEYTHRMTHKVLYTVFLLSAYFDIYESSYCCKPKRIWEDGLWLGNYEYLNSQ